MRFQLCHFYLQLQIHNREGANSYFRFLAELVNEPKAFPVAPHR
jgi:hypothetical protein